MNNGSPTNIRALKPFEQVHSKCFICDEKDFHKYWDPESNAHICRKCVGHVIQAEEALVSIDGLCKPPIQVQSGNCNESKRR